MPDGDPWVLKNGTDVVCLRAGEADAVNTVFDKIVQWLPDILTRFFVASATIKILPFVLKNVFGLEKTKKPPVQQEEQLVEVKANDNKEIVSTSGKEVA